MESTDRAELLVLRAQGGDRGAFGELVETCEHRLAAFIRSRLGRGLRERVEVADILQETVLRAFSSIRRFRWQDEDSFFRWFSAIAAYVIRDLAHEMRKDRVVLREGDAVASGVSPSRAMRRAERLHRLRRAIKKLSPEHREVVTLVCLRGLKVKEAAERMQRSPGAVRNLLLRALKKLRSSFGETESLHLSEELFKSQGGNHGA